MSKYDYNLDLENRTSLSVLLQMIEPNSNILEFGPAHGRMTRYLKEILKCTVTIVEICEEAGKEAAQYAKKAFLGPEKGNIETYTWSNEINEKFDYIIFADVLEHLHNPQIVLKTCKTFLNDKGSILVSIPNIAHNSIIINLLNDKFEYTPIGLLDDTHIHLFTYYSFKNLIKEVDLFSVKEEALYANVGENEIKNSYNDIPSDVSKYLKQRLSGTIYQYIFQLKTYKNNTDESTLDDIGNTEGYEAICYYKCQNNNNYKEENTVKVRYNPKQNKVEFDLSFIENILELRIDLIDKPCLVVYNRIYEIDKNNNINNLNISLNNAHCSINNINFYNTSDPYIIITKVSSKLSKIVIEFELIDYEMENLEAYSFLNNIERQIEELNKAIELKDNHISNIEKQIEELNKAIELKDNHIRNIEKQTEELNKVIELKNNHIRNIEKQTEELNKAIKLKDNYISNIEKQTEELNKAIELKDNHISNIEKQIEELNKAIELKNNHISNVEENIKLLNNEIERQKEELLLKDNHIKNIISQKEALQKDIRKLNELKEKYKNELDEVYGTLLGKVIKKTKK